MAELGLIAGVGMLIAFACTLGFLPAALALFRPRGEAREIGFAWGDPVEARLFRVRLPVLAAFAALAVLGGGAAAAADLRFRPAAHQGPDHRGDAHAGAT